MSPPAVPPASAGDALNPLDPEWVERFRRDLASALGRAPAAEHRLGVAVSGGGDSMAMLVLAHAAYPGQVIAATVDHGLRSASAQEAEMVAAYCRTLGIPHAILTPTAPITGASIQAQAREARYELLRGWVESERASALMTAHHADDQAETFLMRAARASGIAGLAAIREMREIVDRVLLVRPLLGWRRNTLREIATAAAAPFVDDPANRDDTHDRTRFRALLEANPWLDVAAIAATARHLAEAERALVAVTDRAWNECTAISGDAVRLDPGDLPREVQRRLVRAAISRVRDAAGIDTSDWSAAANIESLLDALSRGVPATRAGVVARPKDRYWHFAPAPPRRSH